MPNNIRAEYNEKGRAYRILKTDYEKQDAEIRSFISSEAGDKWYKKLIKEMLEQNKEVDCKCKLNKIYQATISVEYTLSRKVSNSSSGL